MGMTAPILDLAPRNGTFREDVLAGLSRRGKELPCKYLYDERGSDLFEQICELKEYYPTRCELQIMKRSVDAMAELLGPRCTVIEFGSGSGRKTELLLASLDDPPIYVPVDISATPLELSAASLSGRFPSLTILPVCADYTQPWALPGLADRAERRVVFFPGSTIGNFARPDAVAFLRRVRELVGAGGALLIGVDLRKGSERLERAYDDAQGITAAFNLNLLCRINRELDANFDLRAFRHRVTVNEMAGRVEMHLESLCRQRVRIGDVEILFDRGETICTEHSYKYGLAEFGAMASVARFGVERIWTDPDKLFSVQLLTAQ